MFVYFKLYFLLFITINNYMKTAQNIADNLINDNIFLLKVCSLRQDKWYLGIINLYLNIHFICTTNPLIYWTYYPCSRVNCVWDMSQYDKLSKYQLCKISDTGRVLAFCTVLVRSRLHVGCNVIIRYQLASTYCLCDLISPANVSFNVN